MEQPHPLDTPASAASEPSPPKAEPVPAQATDEKERFDAFRLALIERTPRAYFTFALVLSNVCVYGAMVAEGVSPMRPSIAAMLDWGADFAPLTLSGETWRLFTCMFVHYGALHLGMNMLALWNLGAFVERLFGNLGFLLLYLLSGLAGSFASVIWNPIGVSAGASGAIFGVAGAMLGGAWKLRRSLPRSILRSAKWLAVNVLVLFVVFTVVNQFHGLIDNSAHFGGFLTGVFCGLVLAEPIPHPGRSRRLLRLGLLTMIGAGGLAAAYFSLPRPPADVTALDTHYHRVETQCLREWKSAEERLDAGAISEEEYADVLEKRILPPWKKLREDLDSAENIPAEQQDYVDDLRKIARLREEGWEKLAEAARENDPGEYQQAHQLLDEASDVIERLNAKDGEK